MFSDDQPFILPLMCASGKCIILECVYDVFWKYAILYIFLGTLQCILVPVAGAMAFDVEYARWLEEQNRQINELRAAVNSHAGDTELRIIIDGIMAHYDEIFRLKSNAAKADVFHLLSGMWKTPAERCFLWLGGFRSSELLKLLVNQLEPLTEQQLVGITNLQQSSQQAEDALSQGMEALQQSLAETLSSGSLGSSGTSGNVANYMGQMAMAMGKLGTLEGFIRQTKRIDESGYFEMVYIFKSEAGTTLRE
ncbi:unnamed protein product [Linum tenue]|uniref:DOG1 domain-containing protein n=1 Tax=Linum tenue TaxID=586396 RepID=A0AAV0NTX4_9ROSI|nr:unnamed protein product [Linum tenue]